MNLAHNIEEVSALLQKVKEKGGVLYTNFFPDAGKIAGWLKDRQLYYRATDAGVLFFRKKESFCHLYYYATSLKNVEQLVTGHLPPDTLVTDIIGKAQHITGLVEVFTRPGFSLHAELHRYLRINREGSEFYGPSDEVAAARAEDAEEISRLFKENFDPLAEQVPDRDEVSELIEENKIMIARDHEKIKGFLVRTVTGQTTVLNNFLVHKNFRGEKIGSKLLKHYISGSEGTRRMVLWVMCGNDTAINIYKRHGYVKDDLVDLVLLKQHG